MKLIYRKFQIVCIEWRDDCLEFKPERFDKNNLDYGYNTFGSGIRLCPGKSLAYLELKIATVLLLREWDVAINHDSWKWDENSLILRPYLEASFKPLQNVKQL